MKEKADGYNDGFIIRRASMEDVELIYNMMLEVYDELEDKSVLVCGDIGYVRRNINDTGFTLIAYYRGEASYGDRCTDSDGRNIAVMEPAGIFIFEYPKESQENLGNDIGLEWEELFKVVHMDTVAVRSRFRGHHLQKRMLEEGERQIDNNRYRYLMATAAPYNKPSLNTFLGSGYRIMKVKKKYGGVARAILLKEI